MYYSCTRVASIRQKLLTLMLTAVGIVLLVALWHMPIHTSATGLHPLITSKKGYEVFGFAPYWTIDNLQNVDFTVLSTLSYFNIDVNPDGSLDTSGPGFTSFESTSATDLFTKAHQYGTRVMLTLTQMDAGSITSFLDNPTAQQQAIRHAVALVKNRGIDGVNVDFEYIGDPGSSYREKYAHFISHLTQEMHTSIPGSRVSVSVLATAAKDPTLYAISSLAKGSDEIFLMAYDFANSSSTTVMPTAPLYGYKDGTYWYDVSTAVEDFLTQMPAKKLILGVPWYSYNYPVYQPSSNAATVNSYWTSSQVQTYATASADAAQASGWDGNGQVGWRAYYDSYNGVWRMVYVDDAKSLGLKYDFAKDHSLAGVGMWALGFDNGTSDMWSLLRDKFGIKVADANVVDKTIQEN